MNDRKPMHSSSSPRSGGGWTLQTSLWIPLTLALYSGLPQAAAEPDDGAPAAADAPAANSVVNVVLPRDKSGNYMGEGAINGQSVHFLVDTGASMVIVPEAIAKRIGLKNGKPMPFRTGGGVITHYATELKTLRIGQIQISQAPAAINPHMKEDFVLLGMSALSLLRFSQEGENLVLSYQPGPDAASENQAAEPDRKFRRTARECMGENKVFNQKTLDCLKGN